MQGLQKDSSRSPIAVKTNISGTTSWKSVPDFSTSPSYEILCSTIWEGVRLCDQPIAGLKLIALLELMSGLSSKKMAFGAEKMGTP